MMLLLVILGGAGGAALRLFIDRCFFRAWHGDLPPWAPFTVNFTGCFLLGVTLGGANSHAAPTLVYMLLGGAITTFSIFGHQLLELQQGGHHKMAGLRAFTSWLIGSAAAVCGVVMGMN